MKRFPSRGVAFAALTLVGLSASTLLTGCFEKDEKSSCSSPKGGTCDTAVTVVNPSNTTGSNLVLHLADSTYLVPTGTNWTNFHAKAGDKLLVGYRIKSDTVATSPTGPFVVLGCISLNPKATTGPK